jgi:hypothetical protein
MSLMDAGGGGRQQAPPCVRRVRQIESGFGRALLGLGAFLLVALFATIAVGVLNSNLLWGEANQYARVPIPGKQIVQLPSGDVQVNVAAALPGRGNETPEMPLPKLSLAVIPTVKGAAEPTVENDLGSSTNASDKEVDTQRRVWKVHLPEAGRYLAVVRGDFTGYGVNAQIWFGNEPAPLHGGEIPLAGAIIAAIIFAVGFVVTRIRRGRKPPEEGGEVAPTAGHVGGANARALERVAELERQRSSGAIDDAAFESERRRIEADLRDETQGARR